MQTRHSIVHITNLVVRGKTHAVYAIESPEQVGHMRAAWRGTLRWRVITIQGAGLPFALKDMDMGMRVREME